MPHKERSFELHKTGSGLQSNFKDNKEVAVESMTQTNLKFKIQDYTWYKKGTYAYWRVYHHEAVCQQAETQ